jgi:hypothetical protein
LLYLSHTTSTSTIRKGDKFVLSVDIKNIFNSEIQVISITLITLPGALLDPTKAGTGRLRRRAPMTQFKSSLSSAAVPVQSGESFSCWFEMQVDGRISI